MMPLPGLPVFEGSRLRDVVDIRVDMSSRNRVVSSKTKVKRVRDDEFIDKEAADG